MVVAITHRGQPLGFELLLQQELHHIGGAGGGKLPIGSELPSIYRDIIGVAFHHYIEFLREVSEHGGELVHLGPHLVGEFGLAAFKKSYLALLFECDAHTLFIHRDLTLHLTFFYHLLHVLIGFLHVLAESRGQGVKDDEETDHLRHQIRVIDQPGRSRVAYLRHPGVVFGNHVSGF